MRVTGWAQEDGLTTSKSWEGVVMLRVRLFLESVWLFYERCGYAMRGCVVVPYQYDLVASATDDSDSVGTDWPHFNGSHADSSLTTVKNNQQQTRKPSQKTTQEITHQASTHYSYHCI